MKKNLLNKRPRFSKARFLKDHSFRIAHLTPQAQKVLRHLIDTGTITQREAIMDHSIQSLTRRVTELRDAGFDVSGIWKKHPITGQRYMRYSMDRIN